MDWLLLILAILTGVLLGPIVYRKGQERDKQRACAAEMSHHAKKDNRGKWSIARTIFLSLALFCAISTAICIPFLAGSQVISTISLASFNGTWMFFLVAKLIDIFLHPKRKERGRGVYSLDSD